MSSSISCCLVLLLTIAFLAGRSAVLLRRYNSTDVACLRGLNSQSYLEVSCSSYGSNRLLAVHRVLHALTPQAAGCDVTASATVCCPTPWLPARDCVFSSDQQLSEVRKVCDINISCGSQTLSTAAVGSACPPRNATDGQRLTYGNYSDFVFLEYSCINVDLMVDVTGISGPPKTGQELFIGNNYPMSSSKPLSNTATCCNITTFPQQTLAFEVIDLALTANASGSCMQTVTLSDRLGGAAGSVTLAQFNCTSGHVADRYRQGQDGGVFVSRGSIIGLDLQIVGLNTGRILVRVTATNNSAVTVNCSLDCSQSSLTSSCASAQPSPVNGDRYSPSFNSSKTCLTVPSVSVEMDCTRTSGLISVERVLHAVVPGNCSGVACCPLTYDPCQVCLFPSVEGVPELRRKCDGKEYCSVGMGRSAVGIACPPRSLQDTNLTYTSRYSHFALVQYACINYGLLNDVCHAGLVVENRTELYLETNVYHNGSDKYNTSCACLLTTLCGHRLLFTALDLELASGTVNDSSQCLEQVVISDLGNSSGSVLLDCSHNQLDDDLRNGTIRTGFESDSHVADFRLIINQRHSGKLLFRVTATNGAGVNLTCGQATALGLVNQHRCLTPGSLTTAGTVPTTTATSAATSTATSAATSTAATTITRATRFASPSLSTEINGTAGPVAADGGSGTERLELAVGVSLGTLGFLLLFLVLIFFLLVYRSRRLRRDRGGDQPGVHYQSYPDHSDLASHYGTASPMQTNKHLYIRFLQPDPQLDDASPPYCKAGYLQDPDGYAQPADVGLGHDYITPVATLRQTAARVLGDESHVGVAGGQRSGTDSRGLVNPTCVLSDEADNEFNDTVQNSYS